MWHHQRRSDAHLNASSFLGGTVCFLLLTSSAFRTCQVFGSSMRQNSRMFSNKYHWWSRSSPFANISYGRLSQLTLTFTFETFLRVILTTGESLNSLHSTTPGCSADTWKLMKFGDILYVVKQCRKVILPVLDNNRIGRVPHKLGDVVARPWR